MKVFLSIFLFISTILFTEVWVELYSNNKAEFCLLDMQSEGKSDTDTSENSEDDVEFDYWKIEIGNSWEQLSQTICSNKKNQIPHFMEIPNPPPQHRA